MQTGGGPERIRGDTLGTEHLRTTKLREHCSVCSIHSVSKPGYPSQTRPIVSSPTCLVALARESAGVQHLLLILLVYDTALAQVRGELGWVQGAGQLVSCTLDLFPDGIFFLLLL